MALIVQKFGGSSVGTIDRIQHVASHILKTRAEGHNVVVVVSAMQGETDRLIQLAHAITTTPNPREYDVLVSAGEQVTISLLTMALQSKNATARSYTGPQVGIITNSTHTKARISHIRTDIIQRDLAEGCIVVIAGFQGVDPHGNITTLGRGGSDTTAVALAAALKAKECQIYTDVEGVHFVDPRIIPEARLLDHIDSEDMLEMASLGAKVLQPYSVEIARQHQVPLRVLSSFNAGPGTEIHCTASVSLQKNAITGISLSAKEALVTVLGMPNDPALLGRLLQSFNDAQIEIDLLSQQISPQNNMEIRFTLPRKDCTHSIKLVKTLTQAWKTVEIHSQQDVSKLSLIGNALRSQPTLISQMCAIFGEKSIHIHFIALSEIKISVVVNENYLQSSVRALCDAFHLNDILA